MSESLGNVDGSRFIPNSIRTGSGFGHSINSRRKTWENADGEGDGGGRKSWKPPLLFRCLLIVMLGHNVSFPLHHIVAYREGSFSL